jgi:hypothetical protein
MGRARTFFDAKLGGSIEGRKRSLGDRQEDPIIFFSLREARKVSRGSSDEELLKLFEVKTGGLKLESNHSQPRGFEEIVIHTLSTLDSR